MRRRDTKTIVIQPYVHVDSDEVHKLIESLRRELEARVLVLVNPSASPARKLFTRLHRMAQRGDYLT